MSQPALAFGIMPVHALTIMPYETGVGAMVLCECSVGRGGPCHEPCFSLQISFLA